MVGLEPATVKSTPLSEDWEITPLFRDSAGPIRPGARPALPSRDGKRHRGGRRQSLVRRYCDGVRVAPFTSEDSTNGRLPRPVHPTRSRATTLQTWVRPASR